MTYYYVEKQGVYSHGVYWIGTDLEQGCAVADSLAAGDIDDYHDWNVYEYHSGNKQKLVYAGVR